MREININQTMSIDIFPVIDCSNIKQYFDKASIQLLSLDKFRGNINYVEGVCNGGINFRIHFTDDTHISISVGKTKRIIPVNEHTYPL